MQEVRGEFLAILLKLVNTRLFGGGERKHPAVTWHLAALGRVAGSTGGDNIVPTGAPSPASRDDMIKR